MYGRSSARLEPRNGHTLVVGIVARISGCSSQKEVSLDDQVDHSKEEVAELYQGPVEYRVIATKGKGERLDRPELAEIDQMLRTGEWDVFVMEDVGRLVRGADAVRLWGIAVDHGTRCIAPNDCCDTADENWEEELLSACRDHVGHQTHTSKRLKKKMMKRFKRSGHSVALPIAGYFKPPKDNPSNPKELAKPYSDWQRLDELTPLIQEGCRLLKKTLNCEAVADWFKENGMPVGSYCRRKEWNGKMVRRYFKNPILKGQPGRGFRTTKKHYETGRRISVTNPRGPVYKDYPHLAHLDPVEFDELKALLAENNANRGRKPVNGVDPRSRVPRKRTRYPGQHARCWYCGRHYVWGGNGVTENLMCCGPREWNCWNSFGFKGPLACRRLVEVITSELYRLEGFDTQFAEMVRSANQNRSGGLTERWRRQEKEEASLQRQKDNLVASITELGPRPMLEAKIDELENAERLLVAKRRELETVGSRELKLPFSVAELRRLLEDSFQRLAMDSFEFANLMRELVPDFWVYLVRLIDGGHPLPRAKVTLSLSAIVPDAQHVSGLGELLTREVTVDLFDPPPQREQIRDEAVRLNAQGLSQRQIASRLQTKQPVVQKALQLDRMIQERGLDSPYVLLAEPPSDYGKLKRHLNPRYQFEPLEGYDAPSF